MSSETTADDSIRQRWNVSIVKEYLKRILMAIQGEEDRGPADYAQDVADRVARQITGRYGRWHVEYNNGDKPPPNGEKRLLWWILGVVSPLAVIVIVGGVSLYGEVRALNATLTTGMNAHEQRISRLEAERDQRRNAQPSTP